MMLILILPTIHLKSAILEKEFRFVYIALEPHSYISQEVRKCSSVSISFCGLCAHSLSSLESQVCLRRPFSIAGKCSLSLYIVKAFLKSGSVAVVRYSTTVQSLFRAK